MVVVKNKRVMEERETKNKTIMKYKIETMKSARMEHLIRFKTNTGTGYKSSNKTETHSLLKFIVFSWKNIRLGAYVLDENGLKKMLA